jgi:flagellar basal-body rod protein FlgB
MEQAEDTGIVTHSGNSVNLEAELQAAGAVKREYSLNVAVARAFRRMVMASLRG